MESGHLVFKTRRVFIHPENCAFILAAVNCSYVGYICPHPLKQLMIVRLTLDEQTDAEKFKQFLIDNSYEIIRELETINTEWIKFNQFKKK